LSAIGESLRNWKTAPAIAQMPSISLERALESPNIDYIRWKSHNDWVEQIRIDRRLNQILSCSNDENNALVIGCILPSTNISIPTNQQQQQNPQQPTSQTTFVQQPIISINDSNNLSHSRDSTVINEYINKPSQQQSTGGQYLQPPQSHSQPLTTPQAHYPRNTSIASSSTTENTQKMNVANNTGNVTSLSNHNNNSVTSASSASVKRRPEINETIFKVYKGVKCFDFSFEKNLLITGG
jgi:hypothetical protein